MVDSGAAGSVCSELFAKNTKTKPARGRASTYKSVDGKKLRSIDTKKVAMTIANHEVVVDFEVLPHKEAPIEPSWAMLAAGAISDLGHKVVLGRNDGEIQFADGETLLPMTKKSGVYEMRGRLLAVLEDTEIDVDSFLAKVPLSDDLEADRSLFDPFNHFG